jgi:ABC-type multidrug transport system fused ATPase/permease subunit
MQGTVRTNLDPFGRFSDEVLLRGLRCASLAEDDSGAASVLKKDLSAGGSNLSCGERQLLCLARAVIQDPKVLVMDEPTSSADADTDQALQRMVRTEFHCTTLCIAHRIQTIADSDLVLVMRDGRVLELGPPSELYGKVAGEFRSMCDVTHVSIPSPSMGAAI